MHKLQQQTATLTWHLNLVSEAYLDNYEFLEAPLAEVNPSLMKTIEDNMREDLRNMIKSGESYGKIKTQIQMINADLETAKAAVMVAAITAWR